MAAICLCFAIHEPFFLRRYTIFDVNQDSVYEDDDRSCNHVISLAQNCYLPMTELLYKLFKRYEDAFKISFTVSSSAIDLFEQYVPEVLESLKVLGQTGCVEFITETAPHSLAFLYSKDEFVRQVKAQNARLEQVFGQKPTTFRHTELLFNNDVAQSLGQLGLYTVLAEGTREILGWRNTNYVYNSTKDPKVNILLRNGRLSGDLSTRFSQETWDQWPLTAEKFATWCRAIKSADCINIFGDFHVFGLRHPKESGIFKFMEALPGAILDSPGLRFMTPREVVATYEPKDSLDVPNYISWRDEGCDIKGWLGNEMQRDALTTLYNLTSRIHRLGDTDLLHTFERLQTSDYFHFMSTRWFWESRPDRPSPFSSPYDAYISFMNIVEDFTARLTTAEELAQKEAKTTQQQPQTPIEMPGVNFKTCVRRRRVLTPQSQESETQTEESPRERPAKPMPKKTPKGSKKSPQAHKLAASRSKKTK
ncbi:MAG: glycoside hydrolase family 57 protein [Desulfovibrionaceae bacterium]|nr:glycoside hydrolase family 57 protein [Desulfovibrionaceae bacterium]